MLPLGRSICPFPLGHNGHFRLQKFVGSTIIMNGRPHTTGRRTTQETPMEARTLEKFHSRLTERAYPYRSIRRGRFRAETR